MFGPKWDRPGYEPYQEPEHKKIYLACPYSHPDPEVRKFRFEEANRAAAWLMDKGHIVFSPISHSHPISLVMPAENSSYEFWLKQDFAFLDWCDEVWVLALPGHLTSKGIALELQRAEQKGKKIVHFTP